MEIFPDVIHSISGNDEVLADAKRLLSNIDWKKHHGWEGDNHSLSDPTFTENLLKKHDTEITGHFIHKGIIEYLTILGHSEQTVSGYDITESWLTHTVKGEYARLHQHGTTDISGVYYLQANPETDGNLYFQSGEPIRFSKSLYRMIPNQFDIPAETNKMVLFPGWLWHGTRMSQGEKPRISLSFNVRLFFTNGQNN